MSKHVKRFVIFIGGLLSGFTIGGVFVANKALKSDDIREVIVRKLSDKISEWLFGKKVSPQRPNKVSYRPYYENHERRTNYLFDDIVFETRIAAEKCLDKMIERVNTYGVVSVADMYELAEISHCTFDMHKYGWTDLRNVTVARIRDGYILKLPKTIRID